MTVYFQNKRNFFPRKAWFFAHLFFFLEQEAEIQKFEKTVLIVQKDLSNDTENIKIC